MSWRCSTCGSLHDDLPDIGCQWPDPYFGVPDAERGKRVRATPDTCVIDEEDFFIRGVIMIPVLGQAFNFGLGVWVSQKRENFGVYLQNPDSSDIGPYSGWLSNTLPFYEPDTWAMKARARFQGNGQRPLIELAPCDHPLFIDYSSGITLDRAWQLVHLHQGMTPRADP